MLPNYDKAFQNHVRVSWAPIWVSGHLCDSLRESSWDSGFLHKYTVAPGVEGLSKSPASSETPAVYIVLHEPNPHTAALCFRLNRGLRSVLCTLLLLAKKLFQLCACLLSEEQPDEP